MAEFARHSTFEHPGEHRAEYSTENTIERTEEHSTEHNVQHIAEYSIEHSAEHYAKNPAKYRTHGSNINEFFCCQRLTANPWVNGHFARSFF